jgi:hypothetical protein
MVPGWLWAKQISRTYQKNNQSKKRWGRVSGDRAPAWQAQGPEFELQYQKKKKKAEHATNREREYSHRISIVPHSVSIPCQPKQTIVAGGMVQV